MYLFFQIWTEDHFGHGAVNFITGMGGFLQAVFFGYGGVRLHVEQLTFDPKLPPGTDGMKLIDVDYLGSRFDVTIQAERVLINVTEAPLGSELILTVSSDGSQFLLTKGTSESLFYKAVVCIVRMEKRKRIFFY